MQKKRNIRLLLVLFIVTLSAVIAYYATRPVDKLQVSRDIFSFANTEDIDRVTFSYDSGGHFLKFNGHQWIVNGTYHADHQRVSVLFAILKQMRVRRKVAKQQQAHITAKMREEGAMVTFYKDEEAVHQFLIWGDEGSGLTYTSRSAERDIYIVEIPGYRSFLAGIYLLDQNEWRDPLVFKLNWTNLKDVRVIYPEEPESSFTVAYDSRDFYSITEINATDSAKIVDFLDNISLLYVNDFLSDQEIRNYQKHIKIEPQASIQVKDIGDNVHTLEIFGKLSDDEIIGRIDSIDHAVLNVGKIREIMRPRWFFATKETDDIK